MQNYLIEFEFGFSFDYHHFEEGKDVHSELHHEIYFQLGATVFGPVGVIFVYQFAGSTTPDNAGEPIFVSEEKVGQKCHNGVENCII